MTDRIVAVIDSFPRTYYASLSLVKDALTDPETVDLVVQLSPPRSLQGVTSLPANGVTWHFLCLADSGHGGTSLQP